MVVKIILLAIAALILIVLLRTLTLKPTAAQTAKVELDKSERAEKYGIKINKLKFKSLLGEGRIEGKRCLLLKPQTFMNLSGEAVRDAADFYKIPTENIIVICDDISLEPGKMRIRRKGSHGGQNGMRNIIYHLKDDNFPRIKIGIGAKPNPEYDLADWVLSRFSQNEAKLIKQVADDTVSAIEYMVKGDIDKAMSNYNS